MCKRLVTIENIEVNRTTAQDMGVGRIFSRGPSVDFSKDSHKDSSRGAKNGEI